MIALHWPENFQPPKAESGFFRALREYWFRDRKKYCEVKAEIERQLLAREEPEPSVWGDNPHRRQVARIVGEMIKENYEWPNDYFLPEDPFDILFLMPWDDLEVIEMALGFGEQFKIKLNDEEIVAWFGTTLGDLVDSLLAKCDASQSDGKA